MIITLGNMHNAILVSDRRLINPDRSRDDESNKAFVLITRDARVAIGFSGLAGVPRFGFRTRFWLPQALADSAAPDYTLGGILTRLKARAEHDISRLRAESKRLSIAGVGYQYIDAAPRLIAFRLSNFESPDPQPVVSDDAARDFAPWTWTSDQGTTTGRLRHISGWNIGPDQIDQPWDELYDWLRINKPPAAIVSRAVRMIRLMSDAKETRGLVGSECMSIILPSDQSTSPVSEYHSTEAKVSTYMPGYIEARGGDYGAYVIADTEMGIADPGGTKLISAVPQVPRNRACPCGSGHKYKYCHGRKDITVQLGGK
jgi:hypothetical protein